MSLAGTNPSFRHRAILYEGEDAFVEATLPFLFEGLARDEPTMVATSARKCERLAAELGGDANRVEFLDLTRIGRNPACILPVWRHFADRHDGLTMRGIGEPAWPGRSPAELTECEHHESLLNLAFEEGPAFELACTYDAAALSSEVIERVRHTHPRLVEDGHETASAAYVSPSLAPSPFDGDLPPGPDDATVREFDDDGLADLRGFVLAWARRAGLTRAGAGDLTLAVHELAANSVRHAGGTGTLRAWREDHAVVCEVRDRGTIDQPLAGRELPDLASLDGRGLWVVNHLCDLVQIRSLPDGTVVRVRMGTSR